MFGFSPLFWQLTMTAGSGNKMVCGSRDFFGIFFASREQIGTAFTFLSACSIPAALLPGTSSLRVDNRYGLKNQVRNIPRLAIHSSTASLFRENRMLVRELSLGSRLAGEFRNHFMRVTGIPRTGKNPSAKGGVLTTIPARTRKILNNPVCFWFGQGLKPCPNRRIPSFTEGSGSSTKKSRVFHCCFVG